MKRRKQTLKRRAEFKWQQSEERSAVEAVKRERERSFFQEPENRRRMRNLKR
jgi:hypothetical protein